MPRAEEQLSRSEPSEASEPQSRRPMESSAESAADEPLNAAGANGEQPTAGLHWTVLPELPTPKHGVMCSQYCGGCVFVCVIIAMCVGGTHAFSQDMESPLKQIMLGLVWTEAAAAIVCLLGLAFGDPGVIKRSEER